MKTLLKLLFVGVVILSGCGSADAGDQGLRDRYKKLIPSVVKVEMFDTETNQYMHDGSGFVYDKHTVVAAKHLFSDEPTAKYRVKIGTKYYDIAKLYLSPSNFDVAIVTIKEIIEAPAVKIARKNPQIGDDVMVLGFPLEFSNVLTIGVVNQDLTGTTQLGVTGLIGLSAESLPGNSGGPVFNNKNEVVGIILGGYPGWPIGYATSCETLNQQIAYYKLSTKPLPQ